MRFFFYSDRVGLGQFDVDNAERFLDRGHPRQDLPDGVLGHRRGSLFEGAGPDGAGGFSLENEILDFVGDDDQFEHADPALVAGVGAVAAPDRPEELDGFVLVLGREAQPVESGGVGFVFLAALGAKHADEPLREHADRAGRDEERFDVHVEQAGERSGGVVGVQGGEDQVAGERRLAGEHGCFAVAHLADHRDVGVLAKYAPQHGRERQPGPGVDLDLREAVYLLLDRILDGDDVLVRRVKLIEGRVQGGRLAAPGRARHQNQSVRPCDDFLETAAVFGGESKFVGAAERRALLGDAHHDFFAQDAGQGGDAEVEVDPARAERQAAVLRDALLGDVHVRDDFDARDDGARDGAGQGGSVVEHAVDAVSHADLVPFGLDVNVAGAVGDAAGDDGVDEADDGLFLGARRELLDGQVLYLGGRHLDAVHGDVSGGVGDNVLGIDAHAGQVVQPFDEGVFRRDQRHDVEARHDMGFVDRADVERVDDGEHHPVLVHADREDFVLAKEVLGHDADDGGIDLHVVEVDERDAPLLAEAAGLVFLGDALETDEHVAQGVVAAGLSGLALDLERPFEGLIADGGVFPQNGADGPGVASRERAVTHPAAPEVRRFAQAGRRSRRSRT